MLVTVRLVGPLTATYSGACCEQVTVPLTQKKTSVPPVTNPVPLIVPVKTWPDAGDPGFQLALVKVGIDGGGSGTEKLVERDELPTVV